MICDNFVLKIKKTKIMKKLLFAIVLFIGLLGFSLNFSSCKDNNNEGDTTTLNEKSVYDASDALYAYTEVVGEVLTTADDGDSSKTKTTMSCATITFEPLTGYPKTLTIDYGSVGCNVNGHAISGKITATINDKIRSEGTTIKISFDDFKIDTLSLNGTMSLTISKVDLTSKIIEFSTDFSECSLTIPSGTISLDGNVSYEWDMKTLSDYTDDMFIVKSGNLTGTNRESKTYSINVVTPLTYNVSCGHFVSGQLEVQESNSSYPATIDFGDGSCDNVATVTTTIEIQVGNQTFYQTKTFEITLP